MRKKSTYEIFRSMTYDQKHCTYYMIGCALEGKSAHHNSRYMRAYDSMTEEQMQTVSLLIEKAKEEKTNV